MECAMEVALVRLGTAGFAKVAMTRQLYTWLLGLGDIRFQCDGLDLIWALSSTLYVP